MAALLSHLPLSDPDSGDLIGVIETPKGSSNKYDYDEAYAAFRLAAVMPDGSSFPYDFGFIPSTVGDDGDPLDVLVFLDAAAPVGCIVGIRLIGAIEAEQREKGKDWVRNDRLLAVAVKAQTHAHIHTIDDLRPRLLDEIEAFFRNYNDLNGKEFKPVSRSGPDRARELVDKGAEAFGNKQRGSAQAG